MRADSCAALYQVLTGSSSTPSHAAARGEAESALQKAIEALPPTYAQVVRLYDLECKSAPEVAEAIQRSVGAVFMLRARAHERLRELMGSPSRFLSGSA
jgi:DNA-directed RNA polymerase specialized sigma24 family protein